MYELSINEAKEVAGGDVVSDLAILATVTVLIYYMGAGRPTYYDVETPVYDAWGNEIGVQVDTYRRPGLLWD